ncbi:hypothetical protein NM688_g157 [Phlebia brevispora]|uniref:Uncharacterized protein n=1 Tax=Phlebia brevispora TaxID=194682 RepID=A0ACC1TFE2_9APHY|nr:hypothetical protein NM688_g157 [Phlebia brevispora]
MVPRRFVVCWFTDLGVALISSQARDTLAPGGGAPRSAQVRLINIPGLVSTVINHLLTPNSRVNVHDVHLANPTDGLICQRICPRSNATYDIMIFHQLALALIPAVIMNMQDTVRAAPPGVMRYETLASPSGCSGTDLFSIGWYGSTGTSCLSLSDDAPTDYWINTFLDGCNTYVFSEAGCADDTLVYTVLSPPSPGNEVCLEVGAGFRALNVTCSYLDSD